MPSLSRAMLENDPLRGGRGYGHARPNDYPLLRQNFDVKIKMLNKPVKITDAIRRIDFVNKLIFIWSFWSFAYKMYFRNIFIDIFFLIEDILSHSLN